VASVRRNGGLAPVDEQGFVVGDVDRAYIRPPWDAALDAIVQECVTHWGDRLHSLYVRGSVPRGLAVEGVSDIDCYALVRGPTADIDNGWIEEACAALDERFPFQTGIEIVPFSVEETLTSPDALHRIVRFSLGTNCVCLYGEDVSPTLPRFRPGPEIAVRATNLPAELRHAIEQLESGPDADETRETCTWIATRFVRTGFELVMEREQAYTRDLYPCYETFARHHPARARDMRWALELAVSPSGDARELLPFVRDLGGWLVARGAETFPGLVVEPPRTGR
jgi:hypothetical protein